MSRIGRNDPCPCGSGKKYKKCCLHNPTPHPGDGSVVAENEVVTAAGPDLLAEYDWESYEEESVAELFYQKSKDTYPPEFIGLGFDLWKAYYERSFPVIRKKAVPAAALEYLLATSFGLDVTQAEIARKYGVSAGSISRRSLDMEDELLDILDEIELGIEEVEEDFFASFQPRMHMERMLAKLDQRLSEQEFSSEEEVEQFLGSVHFDEIDASKPVTAREQARELLFDAWDSVGRVERVRLAKQALELYPNSADAYVILAQETAVNVEEMKDYYARGVRAGEQDLGSDFFTENKGYFWRMVETRPYMRAKQGYAECAWELGEHDEALQHYRHMLELNPVDNQGIRYSLIQKLIELRRYEEAEGWLDEYPEESAQMAYNRILVMHGKNGLSKKVEDAMEEAYIVNPHVPDYLLGKRALPDERPEYVGFGDESEAAEYVFDHFRLWWRETDLLKKLNQWRRSSKRKMHS